MSLQIEKTMDGYDEEIIEKQDLVHQDELWAVHVFHNQWRKQESLECRFRGPETQIGPHVYDFRRTVKHNIHARELSTVQGPTQAHYLSLRHWSH